MKIRTQIQLTLSALVGLLALLSIASYIALTIVNKLGDSYPESLVPGVQGYAELRYSALQVQLAVYQKDQAAIDRLTQTLIPATKQFMDENPAPGDPFYGNDYVTNGIDEVCEIILVMLNAAQTEDLSQPPSNRFLEASENFNNIGGQADDIIQFIIDGTRGLISDASEKILNFIIGFSVLSIVLGSVAGFWFARKLSLGLDELRHSFSEISQGNLLAKANSSRKDEFGEIATYFNNLASGLSDTISQLATMTATLSELSQRFKVRGQEFLGSAQQTSKETDMLATAMTEMAATSLEVAKNAELTARQAQDASEQAGSARNLISTSVTRSQALQQQMDDISQQVLQLKEKSSAISSVIDVIRGIAEQTNLLALNAAIEAARAGEQGRGFAVVADEVRSLATRTGESTEEITEVIQSLQDTSEATNEQISKGRSDVENNAQAIADIESSLGVILDNIESISEMNQAIATNAQEQSYVAEEMNVNVVRINSLSEDNTHQTQGINSDIDTIDGLVRNVQGLIAKFRF